MMWLVIPRFFKLVQGLQVQVGSVLTLLQGTDANIGNPIQPFRGTIG